MSIARDADKSSNFPYQPPAPPRQRAVAIRMSFAEAELLDDLLGDIETIAHRDPLFNHVAMPGSRQRREFQSLLDKACIARARTAYKGGRRG